MPTGTIENPDLDALLENFGKNQWRWGYLDFLKATGFRNDSHGQRKWQDFQALDATLKSFDRKTLALFFSRPV